MADDIAKRDFSVILTNLKRKFDITDCKWTESKSFEIKFRTHIGIEQNDHNTYCDNWADEFSQVTDTIWVHKISNTGPKVKFRKQYQCWTYEDKEVQKELLFDPRRCRGTLDIKILGDTKYLSDKISYKRSNKYLRLGLNALIKINFYHLHDVDTTQDYAFFVHRCEPQPEPPKPVVLPNERVSQLVAKMVESAASTSQKAAKRAQEALKRQCIVPEGLIHSVLQPQIDLHEPQTNTYEQPNINAISQKYDPQEAQVIVNPDGQATETYYVQQVVFDSTTQTIQEVISVPASGVPSLTDGHQLVHIPMPQTTHISQVLEIPHQHQADESPRVIQHY